MSASTLPTLPVTLRFRPSLAECFLAVRAISGANPRLRWIVGVAFTASLIGLVLVASSFLSPHVDPGVRVWGKITALLGLMFLGLSQALPTWLTWLNSRGNSRHAGEYSVELTDAGICRTRTLASSFLGWASVERVLETRRFLLIYSAGRCVCFVPNRVFPTAADSAALAEAIRARADRADESAPPSLMAFSDEALFEAPCELSDSESMDAAVETYRKTGTLWSIGLMALAYWAWNVLPLAYTDWARGGWGSVHWFGVILLTLMCALYVAIQPALVRIASRRVTPRRTSRDGALTFGLHEEGIVVSNAHVRDEFRWDAVKRLAETRKFFLFFTSNLTALVLPKRTLEGAEEARVRKLASFHLPGRVQFMS